MTALKLAVRLRLLVTLVSVLGLVVEASLQLTNWKPEFGTAVTTVPDPPEVTICVVLPVRVPLAPAVYARVKVEVAVDVAAGAEFIARVLDADNTGEVLFIVNVDVPAAAAFVVVIVRVTLGTVVLPPVLLDVVVLNVEVAPAGSPVTDKPEIEDTPPLVFGKESV